MKNYIKLVVLLCLSISVSEKSNAQTPWFITGNAGTNTSTNFIGTTDNKPIKFRTNNNVRMQITGSGKVSIGNFTPAFKLDVKGGSINTDSSYRIDGTVVLSVNGFANTFGGAGSGINITSGTYNTSFGYNALSSNQPGEGNTAIGGAALINNQTGSYNTAIGYSAFYNGANGISNTAVGAQAMQGSSGNGNTAVGSLAMAVNTGSQNTGIGYNALFYGAGSHNTAIGYNAGNNNGTATANFTAVGYNAGHLGSNSNTIEIGNNSVSWVGGQQNWSTYSDRRIKDNIQANVPGLSFISKLNPVTYKLNIHRQSEICGLIDTMEWEGKYDIEKITQTGFLAQEVEQAAKECNYDFNGVLAPSGNAKLYSIQYAAFVVPLVKAVQELDKVNAELKSEIGSQKSENEKLKSEIEMIKSVLSEEQQQRLRSLCKDKSLPRADLEMLLEQNSPNPFSEKTVIKFNIPVSAQLAEIKIFSSKGKELKSFSISTKGAGQIEIIANSFAAGIYNYTLMIDGKAADSRQMILTR